MSEVVGEGVLKIRTDTTAVPGDVSKAGKEAGTGYSKGFLGGIKGLALAVGGALAARKVLDFAKSSVAEAREAQKVGAATTAIIKATGGAANVTADQIGDLSNAISEKAGVDDEAIQKGANLLLTFKNVRNEAGKGADVFDRATQAAVDLSAAGFGSIEGGSKMLGKALNDPLKGISALSRAGVTFTDQQKEQIKTLVESGDVLGAQKIILGEVEGQVGGVAAATATAGEKAAVVWGNIQEQVGMMLLPILDKLAGFFVDTLVPVIRNAIEWSKGFGPVFQQLGDTIAGLADQFQPITDWLMQNPELLKGAAIALGAVAAAIGLVSLAMGVLAIATSPITLIILAIAALGAGIAYLWKNSDTFRTVVTQLGEQLRVMGTQLLSTLIPAIKTLAAQALPVLKQVAAAAIVLVGHIGEIAAAVIPMVQAFAARALPIIQELATFIITQVIPALVSLATWVGDTITPVIVKLAEVFTKSILPALGEVAQFVVTQLLPALLGIFKEVATNLKPVFDQLAVTLTTQVLPAIAKAADIFRTKLLPVLQPIIMKVVQVIGVLLKMAALILGKVLPVIIKLIGWWISHFIPAVVKVVQVIAKVISILVGLGKGIVDAIGFIGRMQTAMVVLADKGIGAVVRAVASLPGKLLALGRKLFNAGKSIIGQFVKGLAGAGSLVSDISGNVWDALKGLINDAIDHLNSALEFDIKVHGIGVSINPPDISHLQGGTPSWRGGVAMVGEVGPELVALPRGAQVSTAARTSQLVGDGIDYARLGAAVAAAVAPLLRPIELHTPTSDPDALVMSLLNRLAVT